MPERCIDASIAVKWFIKGENFRQKALKFLRESQAAGIKLIAPPLFEMETDSVIQTRVVEGKTTPQVADQTLTRRLKKLNYFSLPKNPQTEERL